MPGRDYYLKGRNDSTLMAYQNFAVEVAIMLNADPARARKEMTEIVDFEVLLANVRRAVNLVKLGVRRSGCDEIFD